MTTPLKFRAWHKDHKRIFDVVQIGWDGDFIVVWIKGVELNVPCPGMDVIMLQFTGLTDKNGDEIFEGDIISYRASDMNEAATGHVRFSGAAFIVVFAGFFFLNTIAQDCQVIGNIYENPNLLLLIHEEA